MLGLLNGLKLEFVQVALGNTVQRQKQDGQPKLGAWGLVAELHQQTDTTREAGDDGAGESCFFLTAEWSR